MKKAPNYIVKVPNNEEGKFIISELKKYLNNKSYMIRVRGSSPNKKLVKKLNLKLRMFEDSVPIPMATQLRIYVHKREPHGRRGEVIGISNLDATNFWRERGEHWLTKYEELKKRPYENLLL